MCEVSAFVVKDGNEELILEDVEFLEPQADNKIFMRSIFGEQKTVTGTIREIQFVGHKIILDPA